MHILKWFSVILVSFLLIACGGNDDNNLADAVAVADPNTISGDMFCLDEDKCPTDNPLTITGQNSATWVASAWKIIFDTLNMGTILSKMIATTSFVESSIIQTSEESFNLSNFAKRQIERVKNLGLFATPTLATDTVITHHNIPCEQGGTSDFILADNDDNQNFSIGDTITIINHDCIEDQKTTYGELSMTLIKDEPNWSMNFIFTNFTAIDWEGILTFKGDFSMNIATNVLFESTASIASLTVVDSETTHILNNISLKLTIEESPTGRLESLGIVGDSLVFVEEIKILSDFSLTLINDLNSLISTMSFNGKFDNPELDGIVSFETLQPLEEFHNDDFPYAGIMKITASNNSSVTLGVLDSVNVRLEVDENSDGAIDQTSETTWTSLDVGSSSHFVLLPGTSPETIEPPDDSADDL
jgi:hypothetical protein